ncbi:MAG: hypothetical protein KTR32_21460 [Granulosicoccus sp.]|nr:hypothetical protein [Granulosicoccus sp.]
MTIPPESSPPYTLRVLTGDEEREVNVDTDLMHDAITLFDKMDQDMDHGVRLSRRFVASPNQTERGQVVANRLLTALHTQNDASATLMAAYLMQRLPELQSVVINVEGETEETFFYNRDGALIQ